MKQRQLDRRDSQSNHTFMTEMRRERRLGLLAELWEFMGTNRKWWMAPIIGLLLIIGVLATVAGTAVAPFIYTLF